MSVSAGGSRPRGVTVVVMGIVGQMPWAGVAWQFLHHLEGLRRLGYDVFYVEDTQNWPGHPDQPTAEQGIRNTLDYMHRVMNAAGMGDRWTYRSPLDHAYHGPLADQVAAVLSRAAVLIDVTASTELTERYLRVPVRIYLETDPVVSQIEIARGERHRIEQLSAYTHHFTYGENFGARDCGVPLGRFTYHPTRPPIVLDWWTGDAPPAAIPPARYTTIAAWRQESNDVEWNGQRYRWSKHHEFMRFIDLPRRRAVEFELALSRISDAERRLLAAHGWRVSDALVVSRDITPYRDFIRSSRAEFTVAKDQNVRLRSGWFSDRSACYLAAARPVITQDTGFVNVLPTGTGLLAFGSMDEILEAIDAVEGNYEKHSFHARDLAAAYFRAETVLGDMMRTVGL